MAAYTLSHVPTTFAEAAFRWAELRCPACVDRQTRILAGRSSDTASDHPPILSSAWMAVSLWPSKKWVYRMVWLIFLWPIISATVRISTPFIIR